MQVPLFSPLMPKWIQDANYKLCTSTAEITSAIDVLSSGGDIALDTETGGLRPFSDPLVGISMSNSIGSGFYFPIQHRRGSNISSSDFEAILKPFINKVQFIYHNGQFDIQFLQKNGMFPGIVSDVLFLARSYDYRRDNSLKPLSEALLGLEVIELQQLTPDFRFDYLDPKESFRYACQDADLTYRLYLQFKDQGIVTPYIHRLESDIVPTIAKMSLCGFPVNFEKAKVHHQNTKDRLAELQQSIYSYAGMSFNIGSNEQLSYVLFEKLGLDPTVYTESGKTSTGEKALQDAKDAHPIVALLLEWRELEKMDSSFYTPYFNRIKQQGVSRIYSHFNPWGPRTGRFSSSNVNLQQVSPAVKEIFIPEPGCYLLEADYSQIEYRIFASECRDPFMMDAFLSGRDMHSATADRLRKYLGLDETEPIPDEKRKKAKTLNFSVLFGSGDRNVAGQLQCSVKEARDLIAEYYRQFPTVAAWKEKMHMKAVAAGYCETRFGRRRYISELDCYSPQLYEYTKTGIPRTADSWTKDKFYKLLHGLRIAVNTPIQGTAADIFKVSLRRLDKSILSSMPVRLHAVVHDSFIMSVDESIDPLEIESKLKKTTEIKIPDYVPIVMDVKFGYNWKNMVKADKFKEIWDGKNTG